MRGSVRLIVHATDGTVAQRLDYDEFGRVTTDSSPGFQPFGFAGGLYDHRSGLVLFGYRVYDPFTGRFLTRDPLWHDGGHSNLYLYVANEPINFIDPDGLYLESTIDIGLMGMDILSIATKIQKGCTNLKNDFISLGANGLGLLLPGVTDLGLLVKRKGWHNRVNNLDTYNKLTPRNKLIADIGMMKVSNRTSSKINHTDMAQQGKNLLRDRLDIIKGALKSNDTEYAELLLRRKSGKMPNGEWIHTGPTPGLHNAIDRVTKVLMFSTIWIHADATQEN